jgi:hypothetical protein
MDEFAYVLIQEFWIKVWEDHYPTPLIEDILLDLGKARIFSIVDARDGFWHVFMDEKNSTSLLSLHCGEDTDGWGCHLEYLQPLRNSRDEWKKR